MPQTVGGHQQGAITTPANNAAIISSVLRGNFTALRTTHNSHDSDPGIHFQSSVAADRPAAGTAGRKWIDTDTRKVYYDNGSAWQEIAYAPLASPTFTGGLTVSDGGMTVTGNSTITGTLGGLTGLTMASGTLSAVDLTVSGTFTPNGLTSNGNLTFSGANRRIIPGTATLVVRNVGNTLNAIVVEAADLTLGPAAGMGGNILVGQAISPTSATTGFLVLPTMAGTPSGAVFSDGAVVVDTTNHRLYVRSGSTWKYASLT